MNNFTALCLGMIAGACFIGMLLLTHIMVTIDDIASLERARIEILKEKINDIT